jgi:2-polyprenyl-6-methoxyphenol hydroxylase-like FAD-dependent oxidoreductase
MAAPTVLISGAGIAGPALAFWLNKNGYRVTIVELADGIRPGGQTVDLRGAGGDVVERIGLIDQMRQRSLDQRGVAWIRADGSRRACRSPPSAATVWCPSSRSCVATWSMCCIRRPRIARTEYRFNTRIEDLNQNEDAVRAMLSDGTTLSADLVVGCDGPHSAVRRLVFGPEEQFVKPLGGYNAWFTAPEPVGLDGWHLMYQAPGLNASMRPSHDPTMCKGRTRFSVGTGRV